MIKSFYGKRGGLVSIFLVAILVPLMAFGTVLSEFARLRSAENVFGEAVDSGMTSILANYDKDLLDRFGLLAMAQPGSDYSEKLKDYIKSNLGGGKDEELISNVLSMDGVELEQLYSLNDNDMLRKQIMEFSKERVPLKLALDGIDYLIDELKSKFKTFEEIFKVIEKSADTLEKLSDMIVSLSDTQIQYEDLKGKINQYKKDRFKEKIKDKIKNRSDGIETLIKTYDKNLDLAKEAVDFSLKKYISDNSVNMKIRPYIEVLANDSKGEFRALVEYYKKNNNKIAVSSNDAGVLLALGKYQDQLEKDEIVDEEHKESWGEGLEKDRTIKSAWKSFWKNYKDKETAVNKAEEKAETAKNQIISQLNEIIRLAEAWKVSISDIAVSMEKFYDNLKDNQEKFHNIVDSAKGTMIQAAKLSNYIESEDKKDELKKKYSEEEEKTLTDKQKEERKEQKKKEEKQIKKEKEEKDALADVVNDGSNDLAKIRNGVSDLFVQLGESGIKGLSRTLKEIVPGKIQLISDEANHLKTQIASSSKINTGLLLERSTSSDLPGKDLYVYFGAACKIFIESMFLKIVTDIASAFWNMIKEFFDHVLKVIQIIGAMATGTYAGDGRHKVLIREDTWNSLTSSEGQSVESVHKDSDSALESKWVRENQRFADEVRYDIGDLDPENKFSGANQMAAALTIVRDSILTIIQEMQAVRSGKNFLEKAANLTPFKVAKDIPHIYNIIKAIKKLVDEVKILKTGVVGVIGTVLLEEVLVNTYAAGMFADRTTRYNSGWTTLNGQKSKSITFGGDTYLTLQDLSDDFWGALKDANEASGKATKKMKTFLESFSKNVTNQYSDSAFAEAQLEYILKGKQSESLNEAMVLGDLFVLRLICNIPGAATNEIAAECGLLYPLAFVLVLLAETMLDLMFLVNGVSVPAIKLSTNCFISESNLDTLVTKIIDVAKNKYKATSSVLHIARATGAYRDMMDELEDEDALEARKNRSFWEKKASFELSYTQHLWIFLMTVPQEEKLTRIGNLIEMEMRKKKVSISNFELAKAYTYLRVKANANWNPLLPIPGTSGNVLLKQEKIYYRGY